MLLTLIKKPHLYRWNVLIIIYLQEKDNNKLQLYKSYQTGIGTKNIDREISGQGLNPGRSDIHWVRFLAKPQT
jgi:hypothetical protein